MKCQNCGAENLEGKKFCGDCGAMLLEPTVSNIDSIQPILQRPHRAPAVGNGMPSERLRLRRIGQAALMVGFAVLVVSMILFVLSNALTDQVGRLISEGDWVRATDVADMVDSVELGAWVTLSVAIVSIVIGAVAYISSEEALSIRERS